MRWFCEACMMYCLCLNSKYTHDVRVESDDYMLINSNVTFVPGGAMQQNVTISLVDDTALELPETFSLQLTLVEDNERVEIEPNRATISISDDDCKLYYQGCFKRS